MVDAAAPWIDRLASAWLIRRLLTPKPGLSGLQHWITVLPGRWDLIFEGAAFTHTGAKVTFGGSIGECRTDTGYGPESYRRISAFP